MQASDNDEATVRDHFVADIGVDLSSRGGR